MNTLTVALPGREYDIVIGRGLLSQAGERVRAVLPKARKLAVVTPLQCPGAGQPVRHRV